MGSFQTSLFFSRLFGQSTDDKDKEKDRYIDEYPKVNGTAMGFLKFFKMLFYH